MHRSILKAGFVVLSTSRNSRTDEGQTVGRMRTAKGAVSPQLNGTSVTAGGREKVRRIVTSRLFMRYLGRGWDEFAHGNVPSLEANEEKQTVFGLPLSYRRSLANQPSQRPHRGKGLGTWTEEGLIRLTSRNRVVG